MVILCRMAVDALCEPNVICGPYFWQLMWKNQPIYGTFFGVGREQAQSHTQGSRVLDPSWVFYFLLVSEAENPQCTQTQVQTQALPQLQISMSFGEQSEITIPWCIAAYYASADFQQLPESFGQYVCVPLKTHFITSRYHLSDSIQLSITWLYPACFNGAAPGSTAVQPKGGLQLLISILCTRL